MSTLVSAPTLRKVGGKGYEIGEALRLGRHPYNEVSLGDPSVSRYHCWITLTGAGFVIQDLDSTNGTFVNGARVAKKVIEAGDRIRVGEVEFVFGED